MTTGHSGGVKLVIGLNVALDERDPLTQQHCDRVTGLSLELGKRCGLSTRELRLLRFIARLHDVGKIGIPDAVLKKPGALDADEWVIMKSHPIRSERIIQASGLRDGDYIGRAVRHHHERFDGDGYPDRLAGEEIPVVSRIVAIADTYDAMARLRMYGPMKSHAEIVVELQRVAGSQHDSYLTAKFVQLIENSAFRTGP